MRCQARHVLLFGILLGLAASGCSSASDKGTVRGEVTLDGQPLKEGVIRFVPADGNSATADARILDGRYEAQVPPGQKRVEISAPKVVGKGKRMYDTPDSPTVDDVRELLPARYNARSELRLTVQAGTQEKKFELKTDK